MSGPHVRPARLDRRGLYGTITAGRGPCGTAPFQRRRGGSSVLAPSCRGGEPKRGLPSGCVRRLRLRRHRDPGEIHMRLRMRLHAMLMLRPMCVLHSSGCCTFMRPVVGPHQQRVGSVVSRPRFRLRPLRPCAGRLASLRLLRIDLRPTLRVGRSVAQCTSPGLQLEETKTFDEAKAYDDGVHVPVYRRQEIGTHRS
jgi:hypothetical protein